ncbi:MAG TPA: hypothetical protein VI564_02105 [Candidatus Nanoarchaeia archaeon]|nr:hypothetical protein [Candidatus Nanoarchaeia archaeon]
MGFYAEYWSTLFKSPGPTAFKIRRRIRKIERLSKRAENLLYHDFPELVEKEHKVTKFLKEFVKFIREIKGIGGNCFEILFNEMTQDMSEFHEVDEILKELDDFWKKMPSHKIFRKLELEFLLKLIKTLQSDEVQDRAEYREVEAIINEANTKNVEKEHEDFMATIRDRFKQKKQMHNMFESLAWRRGSKLVRRAIKATQAHRNEMWAILKKASKKSTQENEMKKYAIKLEVQLNAIGDNVALMVKESYLVKERAILMVFRLIYIADTAKKSVREEVNKHFLPSAPVNEDFKALEEAVAHIGKDFHNTLSQEFRIVIHDISKLEVEAKKLEKEIEST